MGGHRRGCARTTAAPAASHSCAAATSSSSVTGNPGTSDFDTSAPVGATVMSVRAPGMARIVPRMLWHDSGVRAVVQRATRAAVFVAGTVVGELRLRPRRPGRGHALRHRGSGGATRGQGARAAHPGRRTIGRRSACPVAGDQSVHPVRRHAKGRRPSWSAAAPSEIAEPLVERLVSVLRDRGAHVETGVFGAHMDVELVNDGPVTLILEV